MSKQRLRWTHGRRSRRARPAGVSRLTAAMTVVAARARRWDLLRYRRVRRGLAALVAGAVMSLAFPEVNVWVAAPLGLGLLAAALTGAGARGGFVLGLIAGVAFFLPSLSWSGIYVGATPWVALSLLEALFVGLAGAVYGSLSRAGRVRPLAFALVWVSAEGARARVPYSGFPWLKVAFSQADSPFGRLAAVAGTPGVALVLALTGALVALAAQHTLAAGPPQSLDDLPRPPSGPPGTQAARRRLGRRATLPALRAVRAARVVSPTAASVASPPAALTAVLTAALAASLTVSGYAVALPVTGPTAQFLGVQGNVPRAGLDFNAERRAVLDNHVAATVRAQRETTAGRAPRPDLVVWPENASDIDPLRNADARSLIEQTVSTVDAPMVVGGLLEEPAPGLSNVALLFEPGRGNTARYVKQHPVPFAEYIPNRAFWRRLSSQVDLVRRDMVAGDRTGVFSTAGANGERIQAGLAICFEVAYDALMRDAVEQGANVLIVQTNNATFGFTAESAQQLAISRIRAMEFGRSVVHVSTVGQSALIRPDGTVLQSTQLFTQAVVRGALPLRQERTVATRLGQLPEQVAALALAGLLGGSLLSGRRRPAGASRRTRG